MKKLILTACLLCCVFLSVGADRLNVATYNIRYANKNDSLDGNGWGQRSKVICNMIRFHGFDIFGLQEVMYWQLDDMRAVLTEYSAIGVGRIDQKKKGEHCPIFYRTDRFELLDSGTFWLSDDPESKPMGWDAALERICTWGKFRDKQAGKVFWFFNTHFDHRGVQARIESSKLMLSKIRTIANGEPAMFMGDLNFDQTHESYKLLSGSGTLKECYENAGIRLATNGTFNSFNTNAFTTSRIDHIFVSPTIEVLRYGVLTDVYWTPGDTKATLKDSPHEISAKNYKPRTPSDHYPVMVQLEYGK